MQRNYAITMAPDPQTLINLVNDELNKGRRVVGGPFLIPAHVEQPRIHGAKAMPVVLFAQATVVDTDDDMRALIAPFLGALPSALAKLGVPLPEDPNPKASSEGRPDES